MDDNWHAEFFRITGQLTAVAHRLAASHANPGVSPPPLRHAGLQPADNAIAERLYAARRRRDWIFGERLFAEPAWDMLLDLARHRETSRRMAVSDLCIGSCAPPTTALRWIDRLLEEGLIRRVPDQRDRRRIFIELTPLAETRLAAYFLDP